MSIYGSPKPRIASPKPRGKSLGGIVGNLANELGIPLLPWQQYVMDDALTINAKGDWVKTTTGVLIARQNGKTHLMRMRILAGLFVFGEKSIIAMAQNRQLSLETFREVVDLAESLPWMRKRIKRVSKTNGQEELEIYCHHYPKGCDTKCARIRKYSIRAATSQGARGASANLLYVDELREITPEAWTAARPLTRATGGTTWITSNAGDASSVVLNELRQKALQMKSDRLGWYEWSAPEGARIDDVKAWQAANPALGYTVSLESLQDSVATDTEDAIRTEMLCQWVSSISSPWSMNEWSEVIDPKLTLEPGHETYMGLDLNFARTKAFLVCAQVRGDRVAVFLTEWQRDGGLIDTELAADLAEICRRFNTRVISFDPKTAGHITPHLQRVGIPATPIPWASAQFSIFCDVTLSAINSKVLQHAGQKTLTDHLLACARRPSSDGGWRIARQASVNDISAAVAMVMAVGHAATPRASVGVSVV